MSTGGAALLGLSVGIVVALGHAAYVLWRDE